MSYFWSVSECGLRHEIQVPDEIKAQPAEMIFAWLAAETRRREAETR